MQLVIDAGNTRVKAALFQGQELVHWQYVSADDQWSPLVGQATRVMVCASGTPPDTAAWGLPTQVVGPHLQLPFANTYRYPEKLGADRIALLAGAMQQHPGENVLVIDAGTCVTIDMLTADGTFAGGVISPGIGLRLRAMHQFTARLPQLPWPLAPDQLASLLPALFPFDEQENEAVIARKITESIAAENNGPAFPLAGQETAECMYSGAIRGARAEVFATILAFEQQFGPLTTVITGGDHTIFEKVRKGGTFVSPHLLLQGCNYLLLLNA